MDNKNKGTNTSSNLSFAKALAYGFVISSIGILIAIIGFLLKSK